jgi:hypothetical protein
VRVAFYAEMYGFPLTIYFLARYFGLDLAWTEGGNLWAQLFGTPIERAGRHEAGGGFLVPIHPAPPRSSTAGARCGASPAAM